MDRKSAGEFLVGLYIVVWTFLRIGAGYLLFLWVVPLLMFFLMYSV